MQSGTRVRGGQSVMLTGMQHKPLRGTRSVHSTMPRVQFRKQTSEAASQDGSAVHPKLLVWADVAQEQSQVGAPIAEELLRNHPDRAWFLTDQQKQRIYEHEVSLKGQQAADELAKGLRARILCGPALLSHDGSSCGCRAISQMLPQVVVLDNNQPAYTAISYSCVCFQDALMPHLSLFSLPVSALSCVASHVAHSARCACAAQAVPNHDSPFQHQCRAWSKTVMAGHPKGPWPGIDRSKYSSVVDWLLANNRVASYLSPQQISELRVNEANMVEESVPEHEVLRRLRIAIGNKGQKAWNTGQAHSAGVRCNGVLICLAPACMPGHTAFRKRSKATLWR